MAKVFSGLIYTWVMITYIPAAVVDIETFYGGGLDMYHQFWIDPAGFPSYLYKTFYITDFNIGRTDSDFIRTVFDGIKVIHFLLNFLSGGNLFTNVLLFNCLASWLFLRCWVYLKILTGNWWLGAWIFLFPSAFFFTSVILKEGIECILIALILPIFLSPRNGIGWTNRIWLTVLFLLLFFFKYLIAFTFLGSLLFYTLFKKYPLVKGRLVMVASVLALLVFFNIGKLLPSFNLPNYIVERRLEFQELEANSALNMRTLRPDFLSFVKALPECLKNVLFSPLPGEGGKITYLIFSAEIFIFWFVLLVMLIQGRKSGWVSPGSEAWALLLFSFINLTIIGYTITNIGAIIRYRSIFMPGIGYFIFIASGGFNLISKRFRNLSN
jgi:hypothetical protein